MDASAPDGSSFVLLSCSSTTAAKQGLCCAIAYPGGARVLNCGDLLKKKKKSIINKFKIKICSELTPHTIAGKQECSGVFLCQWVSVFCKHFHPVKSLVGLHLLAG